MSKTKAPSPIEHHRNTIRDLEATRCRHSHYAARTEHQRIERRWREYILAMSTTKSSRASLCPNKHHNRRGRRDWYKHEHTQPTQQSDLPEMGQRHRLVAQDPRTIQSHQISNESRRYRNSNGSLQPEKRRYVGSSAR